MGRNFLSTSKRLRGVWSWSLRAAMALIVALSWLTSRDPDLAGRARALEDARALAPELQGEAELMLARLAASGAGGSRRVRVDADGRLLEPAALPAGVERLDHAVGVLAGAPTPAALSLAEARAALRRDHPEDALRSLDQGRADLLESEDATRAWLGLERARALQALDRPLEAAAELEALAAETGAAELLDGASLRLVVMQRWIDVEDEERAGSLRRELLDALLRGELPLAPGQLRFEATLLAAALAEVDGSLASSVDSAVAAFADAGAAQDALAARGRTAAPPTAAVLPLPDGRSLVLGADGLGAIFPAAVVPRTLRAALEALLPSHAAFALVEPGEPAADIVGRVAAPPGMPDDWRLTLVGPEVYSESAGRRQQLLWGACLLLVAALLAVERLGLRALRRRAELEQARAEFVAGVSHELRTPAASIALLAGNLAEGRVVEPARLQEYYLTLQRDANRLQRLVADVLDVSRLERNSFRVEPQPTDPAALLRQAAAEHAPRLADAGLELRLALSEPLPETALDPGAVERALANLLENARKYASDGGVVELRAEADDQELRVVVEDRGPGIPAALRERVFRPFERGPAENGLAAGAGLGLALVRETLLAHGGSVELAGGADGAGARFTLRFPLANLPATDR